jgi:hypothetical protein
MKKISLCYMLLAVFLIISALGISFIESKNANKKKIGTNSQQTKVGANVKKEEKSENANTGWLSYENKQAKFSLNYPKDWTFVEQSDEYGNMIVGFTSPETKKAIEGEIRKMGGNYGNSGVDVTVTYAPSIADETVNKSNGYGASTLEELIKRDSTIEKIGSMDLDGLESTEVIAHGEGAEYGIYMEKAGHLYEIFFSKRMTKESLSVTEKKILSTFKAG